MLKFKDLKIRELNVKKMSVAEQTELGNKIHSLMENGTLEGDN